MPRSTPPLLPPFQRPPSRVAIRRVESYQADITAILRETLTEFDLPIRDKIVLLKPNLVGFDPLGVMNTNPIVIAGAREAFLALGAAAVGPRATIFKMSKSKVPLMYSAFPVVIMTPSVSTYSAQKPSCQPVAAAHEHWHKVFEGAAAIPSKNVSVEAEARELVETPLRDRVVLLLCLRNWTTL